MPRPLPSTNSYLVEISGWDTHENFFVEKTQLDWSEQHGKKAYLRRPVREGAVIFVRLIAPTASGQTLPIAYQAQKLEQTSSGDVWEVSIAQLRPRPGNPISDQEPAEASKEQ